MNNGTNHKIKDMVELGGLLAPLKAEGKKIVQCHGVFDLLHIGHIRHFEEARAFGDILVATITPDRFVNKGPTRPIFNEQLRAEAIAALDCVDHVAINQSPLAVEAIKTLNPDFYVKGPDYKEMGDDKTGGILQEEHAVRSVGGKIVFTDDITFSASSLINRHLPIYTDDVKNYLAGFTSANGVDQVLGYLDTARKLKVLVIGETIIDEYLYCETMGKAGKEPVLAARHLNSERFAGGVVAGVNHVAGISDHVELISFLGSTDSYEDFVREKLLPSVKPTFLYRENGTPTIVKRRFVEAYPLQKLFEIYIMEDGDNHESETKSLCEKLEDILPKFDVVIVMDYGHGMIVPEVVDLLSNKTKFLAVNTQINAGNRGFNTVSKYPRADYLCVSENEIRLDARNRRQSLENIIEDVSERLSCPSIVITKGVYGCISYNAKEGFFDNPALAIQVVDRVGAGDAVFAITSLCVAQDAPMDIVGFIANAVGAEAVATVGHRETVDHTSLSRHIEYLFK